MSILQEIITHKRGEVQTRKELYPVKLLEKSIYFQSPVVSLKRYLLRTDLVGVIAEIKRKSPSQGFINRYLSVEELSIGYMQAGASALSVLTDETYFGGAPQDLTVARRFNFCPILRKDFIVDEYQIIEARSIGADAILLIAAALRPEQLHRLAAFAESFGLEVLLEVHTKEELAASVCDAIDVVGVNNRDLQTLAVDTRRSFELGALVPPHMVKISESGIDSSELAASLKRAGFNGLLIGELFMKSSKPYQTCAAFIRDLEQRLMTAQVAAQ